jgi:ribosomal protein S20
LTSVEKLRTQMQRVADAMQAGDADRAGAEASVASRIAQRMLEPK